METEVIPLSALEHWSYCQRQCMLIHLEQTFTDNVQTVRGHHAHERVHRESEHQEDGVQVVRGMTLWSDELGLIGKADVVEFHPDRVVPVEYKVGSRGPWQHAELQLAGQALCLEEMLGVVIGEGAVYYRGSRRREAVVIDEELRGAARNAIDAIRAALQVSAMPAPVADARCPRCSLFDACLPNTVAGARRRRLLAAELCKTDGWYAAEVE